MENPGRDKIDEIEISEKYRRMVFSFEHDNVHIFQKRNQITTLAENSIL